MRLTLLVPILSFFCIYALNAQDPYYINYGTKDGLPSQEVYDVEVDTTGLVWFTTDRGVCTFDGYDFKTYTTQDGLDDNVNFKIFKDSKERLWFCGYGGGLSIFENGQFSSYFRNDTLINMFNDRWAANVLESTDGSIYTMDFRPRVESLALIQLNQGRVPQQINKSQIDAKFKSVKINETYLIPFGDYGFSINSYLNNNDKTLYLSTAAYKSKGYWFYRSYRSIGNYNEENGNQSQYTFDVVVGGIYIDHKNNLWVPTHKGLYYFEKGLLNKEPIIYFKDKNITGIIEDKEGAFWITSTENGIYYIPTFDVTPVVLNDQDKNYFSIATLEEHIVFGGQKLKLLAIDSSGKLSKYMTSFMIGQEQDMGDLRFISKEGNELFILYNRIIEEKGDLKFIKEKSYYEGIYVRLNIGQIMRVGSGRGFFVYNANNEKVFGSNDIENSFKLGITSIIEMDENIWIGTLKGLHKITDYEYSKVEEELIEGKKSFGRINDIYPDQFGNRWVATIGNGLFYHAKDKAFPIRKEDGLNSDMVNHVLLLNDSTVYLATNKGVNAFNYKFEEDSLIYSEIKSLTISDGLISNFISDIDFWKGNIWITTDNGICYFDPEYINKEFPEIPVTIDELIMNDSSYNINGELVFEKDENDLLINYTGISFRKGNEKDFYRYRLRTDEENPNWVYTNDTIVSYNNMTPGNYAFEVAARNKSNLWTTSPAKVSFMIKPHFTETFWFKAIAIILGSFILALIIYLQFRRFKLREHEKHRLQVAELNALRNQMNPHFVFNSLNAIQSFMFKNDIENANYYMSKFSVLMRNSLQYTRLDFITLQEEIDFVKNYLELEKMRFAEKFDYKINIQDSIDPDFVKVPSLLLQPILENSIKHAFKKIDYKGLIVLDIKEKDENGLEVFIRDNGVGFENADEKKNKADAEYKSLGLDIIRERVALLNNGQFNTKASVDFVNLLDLKKDDTGFQVHFILPIKDV